MRPKIAVSSRQLSFVSVMTALCISTNYLMIGVPNIKFMDLFVFVSGYLMGSLSGIMVGCLTWLVYGTLNPYGFNLPTLAAICIGESFYGIAGGLFSKPQADVSPISGSASTRFLETNLKIGILGFILTFFYDLFTNVVTGLVFEIPLLAYIAMGTTFAVAHEVSNFFFLLGGNVLITAIQKVGVKGR